MKLIFSIHVPNIYEFETFMLQVILQEQMRIFITDACFGTRDLLGSLYVIQKLSVGYEVHLFVSGTLLVCIRSQRRVLDFEVHTRRLYPSQVQVYPGKYERRYARIQRYIMINVEFWGWVRK